MKSNGAKNGRVVKYRMPYAFRQAVYFSCAVMLFVAVLFIPKSWASPTCPVETSVSELIPTDGFQYSGVSVSEAYKDFDKKRPFYIFAKDAEVALLEAVQNNLCAQSSSNAPISVEITFVRLEISASEPEIDRYRTVLTGMQGSYADVSVDKAGRSIKAKIVWNPRRMLRDQLALDGYKFDEGVPLLPFLDSTFHKYIGTYSTQVVHAHPFEMGYIRAAELKGSVPNDMYGLVIRSGRTDRLPFGSVVYWMIDNLVIASRPGYSAMANKAIHQAFESGSPKPLNSVLDIQSPVIHSLYRKSEWISRMWLGRIKPFEPMEHSK